MPSTIITQLLTKRGIVPEAVPAFLHPDFDRDTHDGYLMKGMEVAVKRVERAIATGEKIAIFGDYDADGVPATAVLIRAFQNLGVEVLGLIPTRVSGYGLSAEVVENLLAKGVQLLITVDNGTVAKDEIATLKAAGVDTIVCDHHEPQADHMADAALAILNPKQLDCPYPFKELCGCAIAWKLAISIYTALGKDTAPLKWELDLVALSTIADMVPLVGENRVLALYGMTVLRKSRNLGIQALAAVAGIKLSEISSGGVGFHLAPRINAPSRMHQEIDQGSHVGLQLLTTNDSKEAFRLAEYLNEQNQSRQSLVDVHLQEAELLVQDHLNDYCLVLYKPEWSTGVIGLVAGRMLEKYKRPVIALADEGGVTKGSVRSVDGVHAVELLHHADSLIERYGGHGKAAGLSLKGGVSADQFREAVVSWFDPSQWNLEVLRAAAERKPDLEIPLEEVTTELTDELKLLEPFGIGFPRPLFSSVCTVEGIRKVGAGGVHLACMLREGEWVKKGIAFRMGNAPVEEGKPYRIAYNIEPEVWNGRVSVSCHIQRIDPT